MHLTPPISSQLGRHVRLVVILIAMACMLVGCGAQVLRSEAKLHPASDEAYIVMGMGFGNTSIDAFAATIIQDGSFNWTDSGRGVVRSRYAEDSQRSAAGLGLHGGANYVAAPDGGIAYRSAKVTVGQKVLVYISFLGSAGKDGIRWSCRYINPDDFLTKQFDMPFTFWLPDERYFSNGAMMWNWSSEKALWSFTGCYVTIDRPGVYYLGDLLFHGQAATTTPQDGNRGMTLTGVRLETSSSPEGLQGFLVATGLDALPRIEPDGRFAEHAGKDWWLMAQGKR